MAATYIHDKISINEIDDKMAKSACLKVYRDQDKSELSICFDNSIGGMKHLGRIEACVFKTSSDIHPIKVIYISDSTDLAKLIERFVIQGLPISLLG